MREYKNKMKTNKIFVSFFQGLKLPFDLEQ